jgi:hypothetical protein
MLVEYGSPFTGDSQQEQVPLHRIEQGLMPPSLVNSKPGGLKQRSWVIPIGKT